MQACQIGKQCVARCDATVPQIVGIITSSPVRPTEQNAAPTGNFRVRAAFLILAPTRGYA